MKIIMVMLLAMAALIGGVSGADADNIKPFVRGSWQQIQKTHADRPTIIHFWAVSCGPCRVELPEWAKFSDEQREVALVFVHADAAELPARVRNMLVRSGLNDAENWAFADAFQERLRFEIDPEWIGELPRTVMIARDGTISSFTGTADFAKLLSWIDSQRQGVSR